MDIEQEIKKHRAEAEASFREAARQSNNGRWHINEALKLEQQMRKEGD